MTKITPGIALALFRKINEGPHIGIDSDGNEHRTNTALGDSLELLDKPCYVQRTGRPTLWHTAPAVAFLREWADALEEAGK